MTADARVAAWLRRRILDRIETLEAQSAALRALCMDPRERGEVKAAAERELVAVGDEIAALRRRPELAG